MRSYLAPLLLPLLAACSESHADVVGPFVADLDALSSRCGQLAATVAEADAPKQVSTPLAPRLVLDADGTGGNAEVLDLAQLVDPLGAAPAFDLQLSPSLLTALEWTRPERRSDGSTGGDAAFMRATLEDACSTRYLVVYEVDEYLPARAVEAGAFEAGSVELEVTVVDVTTQAPVARFPVQAVSSREVSAYVRDGDAGALQSWLRSDLWSNARKALASALRERTGAEVRID